MATTVIEAENGVEVLEICRKNEDRIDFLLTDVVMPKMDGYELVEKLSEIYPQLKVLFTSGYSEESRTAHPGFDETKSFIHKPFSPPALALKVREIFDND